MSRHKVEITGVNTANIKVLTNEEMLELFKKMNEGDPFAREDLINGNLKLVLSILRKFTGKVDNLDDLFQVGCLGLVKAIDNFNTSYDVKLSTYACPMIEGEIKRYLRDNNTLRISRSIKDLAYKTLKPKEATPNYLTATAEIGDIENNVMASGKVKALNTVDVGAQVSGEVTRLFVEVGDEVKKGQKMGINW